MVTLLFLGVLGHSSACAQVVQLDLKQAKPIFDSSLSETFAWQLMNASPNTIDGTFHAKVDGQDAFPSGLPNVQGLAPAAVKSGEFDIGPLSTGSHSLTLQFFRTVAVKIPNHPPRKRSVLEATQTLTFAVVKDVDGDGIADGEEQALLERYRPYYLFNSGENFRPISVVDYVASSSLLPSGDEGSDEILTGEQLQANPMLLLEASRNDPHFCSGPDDKMSCSSDLTKNARSTQYHINPLENPPGPGGGDPGRHGATAEQERTQRNIGLYGHVVPIHLDLSDSKLLCDHRWNDVPRPADAPLYYKVEYWQFFGFNSEDRTFDIGDHEGDWVSVQLLIRPASKRSPEKVVRVSHFIHGAEISFNLESDGITKTAPSQFGSGQFVENRGPHFGSDGFQSIDINDKWFWFRCDPEGDMNRANDNTLRMFQDPNTGAFTHPIVYIERGAHEFWPTDLGRVNTIIGGQKYHSPSHDGDGDFFLTNTPINLGEVEAPMSVQGEAPLVLRFNGYWGAFSRETDPPFGPPLHGNWTWPADSSVSWQLPAVLAY